MKLNSDDIETLSVDAVKKSIITAPFLSPYINEKDKEPSWDGKIYIYKNNTKTKSEMLGRIPVQVKGKQVTDFPKNEISYSMQTSDLRNYLYDGGAVLFVVYINEQQETKIYYSELTPLKIRFILNDKKGKKSKTVKLKVFPEDGNKKSTILFNCLENCKKQASFHDSKLYTIDELLKEGVLESLSIPFSSVGNDDPQNTLLTNEVYIYAKIKGSNILHPIEVLPQKLFTQQILNNNIVINGTVFYNCYTMIKTADSTTFKFGESFTIEFTEKASSSCKIHYKNSNKVRVLAKDLDFLLSYIDNGYFEINGKKHPLNYKKASISSFDKQTEYKRLEFAKRTVQVLDLLNCKEDLDLSTLTDEDFQVLNILAVALIDKKPIRGLKENLNPISTIKVGDLKFAIVLENYKDEKGVYFIYDFFKSKLNVTYKDEQGKTHQTSQYSLLDSNNLLEINNLKADALLPSFKLIKKRQSFDRENWFLLDLLKAYDKSNGERKDLLNTAHDFAVWLKDNAKDIDNEIKELNYLQVVKRQRPLNIMEINKLWKMAENSKIQDIFKVAIYLLLDQQIPAEGYFAKLTEEQQSEFKNYPMYHFWKRQECETNG